MGLEGRCLFVRNESRDVVSGVNHDTERVPCSFTFVILPQLVPKPVKLHPNDSIPVLVEVRRPSEHFGGKVVLLDLFRSTLEVLVANVLEKFGLSGSFCKYARTEGNSEFLSLCLV
jgi:hypothetical protein